MTGQIEDENWLELAADSALVYGEGIYYFAQSFNALCRLDLKTGQVRIVAGLSGKNFEEKNLVRELMIYKGEVICIPLTGGQVRMIDLKSGKESWQVKPQKKSLDGRAYFFNAYIREQYCFLFPYYGDELFLLDLDEKKVVKTVNFKKKFKAFADEEYVCCSRSGCYAFADMLYMVMEFNPVIIEFDLCRMEVRFYEIEKTDGYYVYLSGAEGCLYILDNEGKICVWDIQSHSVISSLHLELMEGKKKHSFHDSARQGRYLYLFKRIPSSIYIRIDVETHQVERRSFQKDFEQVGADGKPLQYMVEKDGCFFFLSAKKELYTLYFDTKEVEVLPLAVDLENIREYIRLQERELYERTSEFALEGRYIWTLENLIDKGICSPDKESGDTGAAIYQYCRDSVTKGHGDYDE